MEVAKQKKQFGNVNTSIFISKQKIQVTISLVSATGQMTMVCMKYIFLGSSLFNPSFAF